MSIQSGDLMFRTMQQPQQHQHLRGLSTLAIHSGQNPEQWESNAIVPPIVTSSTFKRTRGNRTVFGLKQNCGVLDSLRSGVNGGLRTRQLEDERYSNICGKQDIGGMTGVGYYDNLSDNMRSLNIRKLQPYGSIYGNEELMYGKNIDSRQFIDGNVQLPNLHGQLQYAYGRNTNPTRTILEKSLAGLENANFALTLSSGNAALTVLTQLLKSGDHILVIDEVYVDTKRFLEDCANRMGVSSSFVDMNNIKETLDEVKPNTRMVWIETPTNPSLTIVDIKEIVEGVKRQQPRAIIVVDNTIATPIFQRPLELGADVVLHSLSKYINGHFDVVMGALITNNEEIFRKLKMLQDILGVSPSPYDCHLVNRGIKTLPLRMKEHQNSAFKIAHFLESNQNIKEVLYPGLRSHPQHDLHRKQMRGFGGVISLRINSGIREVERFLDALKVIQCAESLGGYASLIEQPDRELFERGLEPKYGENFLRLSVGLEDVEDLINDINQALNKMNV